MPPNLALLLLVVFLLLLFRFDPSRQPNTSLALWVPLIWMFFVGSRLPSQWLGIRLGVQAKALEEGNPLDRVIMSVLILLAIGILVSRSFKWGEFLRCNLALMVPIFFALASVLWSDFPLVTFKRWFRDLGSYFVLLVVLSDPFPQEAIRTLLRRLAYLLIPLSILLIRYFHYIGIIYSFWTGGAEFVGATTSKNSLGVVCLVSGLFFFWDTVTRWPDRKERQTRKAIFLNVVFIAMTLWLLFRSDSATSRVCLVIGCLVILVAHSKSVKRHPNILKVLMPAPFFLYLILAYGFDINGELAGQVGRDPSLHGRTDIWKAVLSTHTNWLVGTGYDTFWLGPRLNVVWRWVGHINEAHNGYLEVYLNLGTIGLILLFIFMVTSYKTICNRFSPSLSITSFGSALWTIMLFYNMTEAAAFRGNFLWLTFLLVLFVISALPHSTPGEVPAPKGHLSEGFRTGMRERVLVGGRT